MITDVAPVGTARITLRAPWIRRASIAARARNPVCTASSTRMTVRPARAILERPLRYMSARWAMSWIADEITCSIPAGITGSGACEASLSRTMGCAPFSHTTPHSRPAWAGSPMVCTRSTSMGAWSTCAIACATRTPPRDMPITTGL